MATSSDYDAVYAAFHKALEHHDELTTDDVWPYLDRPPLERNTVGSVFQQAAKAGLIEGTERFIRSTRIEAKGRRVQVWKVRRQDSLFS